MHDAAAMLPVGPVKMLAAVGGGGNMRLYPRLPKGTS